MFIRIFFILSLFLFASDVFAQRLLIGYSVEGMDTYVRNHENSSASFEEGPIEQCEYNSKCTDGGRRQENHNPSLSFEFEPLYFFGNFGLTTSINYSQEFKFRILRFPVNNENKNLDISIRQNRLNFGPFYVIGDKNLGRNKNSSLRVGYLFSYFQRKIEYSEADSNNSTQLNMQQGTGGYFLNIDLRNNLSLYFYYESNQQGGGDSIVFEKDLGETPKLEVREFNFILAYSFYL